MENFMRYSDVTGRTYNVFGSVKILNIAQAIYYIQHNVKLLDLQISTSKKSGDPVLVFIFNKEDTREAYDLWCRRRNDKGNEH